VSWGATYNAAYQKEEDRGIQPDEKDSERRKQESELLKRMLGTEEKIEYNEYFPSFFSDIAVRLNPGHFKPAVLPTVQELSFKVIFSYSGTRL
jgi:hypothetical protein